MAIFSLYQSSRIEDTPNNEQEDYQTVQVTRELFSSLHPRVFDASELFIVEKGLRKKKRDYDQMIEQVRLPEAEPFIIRSITARESYLAIDIK